MKKLLLLLSILCLTFVTQKAWGDDDLPKRGLVMHYSPYASAKNGPYYDVVSRKPLQSYNAATGAMQTYKQKKAGLFGDDDWGFKLDSCLMFDTDLKLSRKNAQMTIMLYVDGENAATTPGPVALMRSGQPDSLWYYPIMVEKNRMIYMEGKPTPEDSAMVKSRWHFDIENGGCSTIFILIDQKTGGHTIYMRDSAAVFYNDRLSQLDEMPDRLLFTQQDNSIIHAFAFWNRLLTVAEIQHYYTGSLSKEYAAKHQIKTPVPIVGNIDEADGVLMHGWGWRTWGWTIGLVVLIIIWAVRRIRNIRVHYAFSGSPLIVLAGIFGTYYLQANLSFDIENMWIFNTVNILAYYFVSFRADPTYNIKNPSGVGSVVGFIGNTFGMLGEILDSIPHTMWEVTYVNRRTGEKSTTIERQNNLIISLFWIIFIIFVIWLFIIFSQIIFYILPLITVFKFIVNFFKERKAFREAQQMTQA